MLHLAHVTAAEAVSSLALFVAGVIAGLVLARLLPRPARVRQDESRR